MDLSPQGANRQINRLNRGVSVTKKESYGNPTWGGGGGFREGFLEEEASHQGAVALLAYMGTDITQEEGKLIGKSPQVSFPLESGFLSRS